MGEARSIRRAANRCPCYKGRNCPFLLSFPLLNDCPLATQIILFQGWSGDGLGTFIGSPNFTECKYLILDRAGQSRCQKMDREVLRELGRDGSDIFHLVTQLSGECFRLAPHVPTSFDLEMGSVLRGPAVSLEHLPSCRPERAEVFCESI